MDRRCAGTVPGSREQLVIDGVPVGRLLVTGEEAEPERGSIMLVVATDAPASDRQLRQNRTPGGFRTRPNRFDRR
ncbi:MAG: P1 family peptidase [Thermomicrobiales bacterium]